MSSFSSIYNQSPALNVTERHVCPQTGCVTLMIISALGFISAVLLTAITIPGISGASTDNIATKILVGTCFAIAFLALCGAIYRCFVARKYSVLIQAKLPEIEKLISNTHQMLNYYDRMMLDYSYSLGRQDIKYLLAIRKILGALEDRHVELVRMSSGRNSSDIESAYSLLTSPLMVYQNSVQSLIDSAPIPPIKAEAIAPTLEALFEDFEADSSLFQFGIRKLA